MTLPFERSAGRATYMRQKKTAQPTCVKRSGRCGREESARKKINSSRSTRQGKRPQNQTAARVCVGGCTFHLSKPSRVRNTGWARPLATKIPVVLLVYRRGKTVTHLGRHNSWFSRRVSQGTQAGTSQYDWPPLRPASSREARAR